MEEFLKDVAQDRAFFFSNGTKARNIYELCHGINALDEASFKFHCNLDHDDFANWIGGALDDIALSQKLRFIKDKSNYLKTINNHIKALERKVYTSRINKKFSDALKSMITDYGYVFLLIFVIIMTCVFTAMIYYQYHSLQSIKTLDEKINYLESRNDCFNNYFNDQIISTKNFLKNESFLDNYCVYNYTTSVKIPQDVLENVPATIPIGDIVSEGNKLIVIVNDSTLVAFANSSSMLPVLNHNTKAIEIKPKDLHIGNIISYKQGNDIIVHRIVDIGRDSDGIYYITKGDNNDAVDSNKVRTEQIQGQIILLIY